MPSESFDLMTAQRRVWESTLPPLEKLVVLAIADFYSRKSPKPFPSVETLAERTGLSKRTVIRVLSSVRARKVIGVGSAGAGRHNVYDLSPLMSLPVSARHRCQRDTSDSAALVPTVQATGVSVAPAPVSESHPKEPREGTHLRNPGSRAHARKRSAVQTSLLSESQKPEQSNDHRVVAVCYFECFERERGEKPVFGSVEGKAVNTLLEKAGSAEKACQYIRRAFLSWRRKNVTIQQIAKDPAAFREDDSSARRRAEVQPVTDRALAAAEEAAASADAMAADGANLAEVHPLRVPASAGVGT